MMIRLYKLCSIAVIVGTFFYIDSCLAQTSYGNVGLFVHPTAEISPDQKLRVNLSYLNVPSSSINREGHWIPFNLNFSLNRRAEIGATYITRISGGKARGSEGLFAKYLLLEETHTRPAIAITGNFLSGDLRLNSVSLAASKSVFRRDRKLFIFHSGIQYVGWRDSDEDTSGICGYVGANIPLSRQFSLQGELGTRLAFDNGATSSIGVLYTGDHGFKIGTGFANNGRSKNGGFFFGIRIPLGGD